MNVTYKLKCETEQQITHNVETCGMLAEHCEALYIRLENGVEMFVPLSGLEWYRVKAVLENG